MGRFSGTSHFQKNKEAELANRMFTQLLPQIFEAFAERISVSFVDEGKPCIDVYLNDEHGCDLKPSLNLSVNPANRELVMRGENGAAVTLGQMRRSTTFNRAVKRCLTEMESRITHLESPQGRTQRALRMA